MPSRPSTLFPPILRSHRRIATSRAAPWHPGINFGTHLLSLEDSRRGRRAAMGTCKLTLNLRGRSGNADMPRATLKGRALHPKGGTTRLNSRRAHRKRGGRTGCREGVKRTAQIHPKVLTIQHHHSMSLRKYHPHHARSRISLQQYIVQMH